MTKIKGTIVLKESVTSMKFGLVFLSGTPLNAYCDDKDRIFIEHPVEKNTFIRAFAGNIVESHWDEDSDILQLAPKAKPRFYQAVLQEVRGNVFDHVYPELKGTPSQCTMTERMGSKEARCPDCGKNIWIILAKESGVVREGGKPYIECMECGYQTHL
jgi:predicted RNA-binding Zn-ribbon protein involved in translation (DUF1610 family)